MAYYSVKRAFFNLLLDAGVARPRACCTRQGGNHLRTARLEWEEAAAQKEVAGVARWLIEARDLLLEQASRTVEIKPEAEFPGEVVTITANKRGLDKLLGPEIPSEKRKKT